MSWLILSALLLSSPLPTTQAPRGPVDSASSRPAEPPRPSVDAPAAIQDNSFLVEEAYNQEPGVIQHISSFQRIPSSRDWFYTFTEEWPVPGQKHQLSVTVPYEKVHAAADGASAFGDVALNYRYQLVGSGDSRVAVAPRFSLLLPAGDERQSRGAGAVGYQVNLPVSVVLAPTLAAHLNAGLTLTPGSRSPRGASADTTGWNLGQSLVWLVRPTFNVLVESAYTRTETVVGPARKEPWSGWFINPGVRWAMNFKSGLQIVPGVSVPIGVGPSRGERALFLYLSFEHPLWR